MPLRESVLLKMKLSQPFRSFLNEWWRLLLLVPGRATFRNLSRYSGYVEKRKLCTNGKKPKYSGSFSCERPRCGRNQERSKDQKPSIVLT